MKVILAGYNIDSEVIEELKKTHPERSDITPETLSAAYARISRDPRPVYELRAAAREEVDKARRSNQTIIFKMGHHSVAEHAVFNFDILGISRLAIEEVEHFRLASFTEKSQRYITLEDDFVIPAEIKASGREKIFVETVRAQNALYHTLYVSLKPFIFETHADLAADRKNHSVLDGWAKEDARYIVSLATGGQLGMTCNARSLEYMIRRFSGSCTAEITELNRKLHDLAKAVAPSILLFTEPNPFDVKTYSDLMAAAPAFGPADDSEAETDVRLVDFTPGADEKVLSALLHSVSDRSFDDCLEAVRALSGEKKKNLIKKAFRRMEFFDSVPREFEHARLTYDLVISASCFAQLKRHRMATITAQAYDPSLGVTVPPSIRAVGLEGVFMEMIERTNRVYYDLEKHAGRAAAYLLTNSHRKRVLLEVNARELYHISRLREDPTAQWDIRKITRSMTGAAKKAMPLVCLLIGGKNDFSQIYENVFGTKPTLFPPPDIRPLTFPLSEGEIPEDISDTK